jgi:hypothetical protein
VAELLSGNGRAGRDGGEGHCLAYYSYKDVEKLEKFMSGKPVAEQELDLLCWKWWLMPKLRCLEENFFTLLW